MELRDAPGGPGHNRLEPGSAPQRGQEWTMHRDVVVRVEAALDSLGEEAER
jgi:hypothetical protein